MTKTVVLILKGIGLLIAVLFSIITATRPDVSIYEYNADVTINESGDMTVVETWDMDYHEDMSVRFRDIAYNKYASNYTLTKSPTNVAYLDTDNIYVKVYKDGIDVSSNIRVGYSFNDDYDELGYLITCEPNRAKCSSIFTDVRLAGGLEGQVTFEYGYTILGAITQYSDISELNWRLFEYAEAKIDQAQITLHLPQNTFTKDDLFVWGHGLSTGTITIVSNNLIVFDMKNIKDGEFPEFRVLMDNSLFPLVEPNNTFITASMNYNTISGYENELIAEYNARIVLAGNILLASAIVFLFMGFIAYMVYRKYDKEYQPEFTGDYYRELPNDDTPAEVSYLYFMKKINNESVTATLLDLIQREYIRLEPRQKKSDEIENFDLTINVTSDRSKLKKHEIQFLDWMFLKIGDGKRVSTNQIENYGVSDITKARSFKTNAQTFIRLAKQESRKHKYFETSAQRNKARILTFNIIPGIMIIVSLILGSIYALNNTLSIIVCFVAIALFTLYVHSIKKRSILGNELYTKWKAFKNFLLDFSNMDDYPIPSVTVWEQYIVYATVLGVADKVMEQLKVKLPAEEITRSRSSFLYTGYNSRDYYYRSLSNRFKSSFASAAVNAHRTVVTYNASRLSSGGGGGGFGGGSSGGGGGGGGRSR